MGSYLGVPVQREWHDIETIEGFLHTEWPSVVIELGTGTGAFSLYLASYCFAHGFKFRTYDLGDKPHPHQRPNARCLEAVVRLGGEVRIADVFDPEIVEEIGLALRDPCLVYCDNGDKPREIQTYAPLIPVGSFIGVHDFGTEVSQGDIDLSGFEVWREMQFIESPNRILKRVSK